MSLAPIRILLVDDSHAFRGLLSEALANAPDLAIVGSVSNGQQAIEALRREAADVVILDLEMPVMDGLSVLPELLRIQPLLSVIVCSTASPDSARSTLEALVGGAVDHVCKPVAAGAAGRVRHVTAELIEKIRALRPPAGSADLARAAGSWTPSPRPAFASRPEVLLIGASTGGPSALHAFFEALPPEFSLPILIVQHMPPVFTRLLAERLQSLTGRTCREAEHDECVKPGRVYVAPGGFHLTVERRNQEPRVTLNRAEPEHHCRPAVDPLFRSAASCYGRTTLALVFTGMGVDGRAGAAALVDAGGRVMVQDQASSVVWGMPGAVATAGLASAVLPPRELADACGRAVRNGQ